MRHMLRNVFCICPLVCLVIVANLLLWNKVLLRRIPFLLQDATAQETLERKKDSFDKIEPPVIPKVFLIEEADFCKRNPNLTIITYVHTATNQTEKRNLTRQTWATANLFDAKVKAGVVFMIGRAKNSDEDLIVKEESSKYHDLVQGDYEDSYRKLSYKALASLQWVHDHCHHVPWMLHVDDDVLVDLFLLTRFLKTLDEEDVFLCRTWTGSYVRREGRWLVRPEEYLPDEYPPYCSGAVWILATRLVGHLLNATNRAPFLWVDDVYVTGVLAKAARIQHSKYLKNYIKKDKIDDKDIGDKFAWVHIENRDYWWQRILKYHGYV